MNLRLPRNQQGITLVGLIFVIAIIGCVAIVALQVIPSFTEYNSIKKAIVSAKAGNSSPAEIRTAFDKQAEVGYITSIGGKDLDIVKNGDDVVVSFAYDKKIPLVGPASLLIEYAGSTDNGARKPGL